MSVERLHLGISTCPNDTFAFHALMEGHIDRRGLAFDIELLDVEELNGRLARGEFDVAKASYHAALLLGSEIGVLPVGSALGFGVGPVLLAAPGRKTGDAGEPTKDDRVLCPGAMTTATLLLRLFHPACTTIEQVLFSEIMPALERGEADYGVCIHEGRFTWQQRGLELVEDLGTRWELETEAPLPLGGIMARHRLGPDVLARLRDAIRDSILWGRDHREATLPTMRGYAQELDDQVIWSHVDLYVNDWTIDFGSEGRQALDRLVARAREVGLTDASTAALRILDPA